MEESRRWVRNLKPARPLRRLNENQGALDLQALHEHLKPNTEVAELCEKSADNSSNSVTVEQFYKVLNMPNQNQAPAKTAISERISYSRDFLIKFASSPMAKKKPDFLPKHPVVLEKANTDEVAELCEKAADNSANSITVEQFYKVLNMPNQSQAPAKTERISYTRDFLIKLASSPMAKKKPDFLPKHPVVLKKARDQDVKQQ